MITIPYDLPSTFEFMLYLPLESSKKEFDPREL